MTLYRDLPEIYWFAATIFHDLTLSIRAFFYYNCMANTGPRRELFATMRLADRAKSFGPRIKIGLQHFILIQYEF